MADARSIVILPGDGIGPEIMEQATRVLHHVNDRFNLNLAVQSFAFGGAAYDESGNPLPDQTLAACREADAILLGAIGGPQYDAAPRDLRPERGLLRLRSELSLFANLRPALLYQQLASASSLRPELVSGLDLMIVRELTGGIYFGQPRGLENRQGQRVAFNTMVYSEEEIRRIAVRAFEIARQRQSKLCSVDKANVLEVSELWRETVTTVGKNYPDVALSHLYVDNAAMQLIREPKQFDVMVTSNLFGDILSDAAAMLTGSIGMLPSASLDAEGKGLYEPVHGSAPDIAGQAIANPLATVLSVSMMLRYTLNEAAAADTVDEAVSQVISNGYRCKDIASDDPGETQVGTQAMGDALLAAMVGE
ncbi:MAG: 3-isopropylmalate dehydrogenase [Granulosicoccus sp.]|nr:3-isopropylmalate dehydrogenase [Granulosicoccus sp.]